VRRKGVAGLPAVDKGQVLRMAIERRLAGAAAARQGRAVLAFGGARLEKEPLEG
jgi:hypothetical protein